MKNSFIFILLLFCIEPALYIRIFFYLLGLTYNFRMISIYIDFPKRKEEPLLGSGDALVDGSESATSSTHFLLHRACMELMYVAMDSTIASL